MVLEVKLMAYQQIQLMIENIFIVDLIQQIV